MLSTVPLSTVALLAAVAQASVIAPPPAAALQGRQATGSDKCTDVHVFLAKGNNEPYPGRQGKLVNAICKGIANCDYEDIVMQNMLPDPYCDSVHEGGTNMVKQMVAYNKKCPKTQLVVSGYSQGAHVVGDGLSGGGGTFFEGCVEKSVTPLDPKSKAGKAVKAVLTFGDTRHTAGRSYNSESGSDGQGLFPRPGDQLARIDKFSSVYRDFCVAGDPICAGGDEVDGHLSYFDVFTDEAAKWVRGKLEMKNVATGDASAPAKTTTGDSSSAAPTGPLTAPTSKGPAPTSTDASQAVSSSSTLPSAPASTAATESAAQEDGGNDDASPAARPAALGASFALAVATLFGMVLV